MDAPLLNRIIRQGLLRNGRIMRFSVCIEDIPGALANLLDLVAKEGGNVLHIHHVRGGKNLPIFVSRLDLEVKTRSHDHIALISELIQDAGYIIQVK